MNRKKYSTKILLLVLALLLCSCSEKSVYVNGEKHKPTMEFIMQFQINDDSDYRYIYDHETNMCHKTTKKTHIGFHNMFYVDKEKTCYDKVNQLRKDKEFGQFNDYYNINGTEIYLYCNHYGDRTNTIVTAKEGVIKEYSVGVADSIFYLYHNDKEIYFGKNFYWRENPYNLSQDIIKLDLEKEEVSEETIEYFNKELNEKFQIEEQLKYGISERFLGTEYRNAIIAEQSDYWLHCITFDSSVGEDSHREYSYLLEKISKITGKVEDVYVGSSELPLDMYKANGGYTLVTYTAPVDELGWRTPVEKIYLVEFNEQFKEMSRKELDSTNFNECSSLNAEEYNGKVYFIGYSKEKTYTRISVYDIEKDIMTDSKNQIDCIPDGFCIIEKIDGKIHHLTARK